MPALHARRLSSTFSGPPCCTMIRISHGRTPHSSIVPLDEQLLALEPSDVAFYLLTCLLTVPEGELNLHNLTLAGEFTRGYPSSFKQQVDPAVSEGWSWLLGRGYLGQRPGSNDLSWVTITPQGRRWHETEKRDFSFFRQSPHLSPDCIISPTLKA